LARRVRVNRFALCYGGQQLEERAGCGYVVQSLIKGLLVFDAAKHVHAIGVERMNCGADIFDAEFFDHQICGEVAADRYHQVAELAEGAGLAFSFVEIGFGINGGIEFEDGAVGDGMKFVVDDEGIIEMQLPFPELVEEFDHYGNFHGAGGVEGIVGSEKVFGFGVEGAKCYGDFGVGIGDALLDLLGGGGEFGVLRWRGEAEEKCS